MAGLYIMKDELRKCIMDYVHQWQHEQIGDATTAELAVMACVLSDEPLSIAEAKSWMGRHSHKSFDTPNKPSSGRSDHSRLSWSSCNSDTSHVAVDGFDDELVVKKVDRPEKPPHSPDETDSLTDFLVPIYEFDRLGSKHWTSPTSSANIFLRRRLFPCTIETPSSHFRIMDLPAEVREIIFEFALQLPHSGVWYDFQTRCKGFGERRLTLHVCTRDRDFISSQYLPNTWNIERHSPNDYAFLKLFKNLSDDQFRHLGHIVWRWTRTEPPSKKYVQQFAALPCLRTLVVDAKEEEVDEFDYMVHWNRNAGLSLDDVSHLTAIKGLHNGVCFGPIARHEQFLRSQMVGFKS